MPETKNDSYWVGFDLGGTKMLAVVYDHQFQEVARKRKKTKGFEGVDTGLERIERTVHEALKEAEVSPQQLAGIGVGCPGPLDFDRGVLLEAPNLGWVDVPIQDVLQQRLGCPVAICNDVDAGVYGEYQFGAGKGARCLVGIFPGTGVGGGCVYEGRIFRGANRSCMEIGHVPLFSDGPVDGAGNLGTLESVASRLAIAAATAQAAFRGQAPWTRANAGTNLSEIRSGLLADAIQQGDQVVEEIVKNAAHYVGRALVGLVHLLAPDKVVMGGGLVEAMPDLMVGTADQTARDRVLPAYRDTFEVVPAQLGDDAAVKGAAAWARELIDH